MPDQVTRRDFIATAAGAATAAACSTAPGPRNVERPNLLFFFPDQHRHDWVGWNPDVPVPTPNLAALRDRGTNFTRAIVNSPVCAPSRACLASAMEYENCGVRGNGDQFPLDHPSYYRLLRYSGYHTMGCGKLDLDKPGKSWNLDGSRYKEPWGFSDLIDNVGKGDGMAAYLRDPVGPKDPYYAFLDSLEPPLGRIWADELKRMRDDRENLWWGETNPVPLPDDAYCDNWIARNGLELLDRKPDGQPWHLVINFVGPHPPNDITESMAARYRGPDRVIDGFSQPDHYEGPFSAEKNLAIRQNYGAMIENIDRWLGIYIDYLRERGELDNTIIVYASDHGEMCGDHGRWGKSVPYSASAGVPLVMAGPGIRQGLESNALTSMIDVAATHLDYGEVKPAEGMQGRSLRPLLDSGQYSEREHQRSGLGKWRMVEDQRYKLVVGEIQGLDDKPRLFDREADPTENENIAEAKPGEVERLRKLLVDV